MAGQLEKKELEKRDRLSYLALYYAIHGDEARSEKVRSALREFEEPELVPVAVRRNEPVGV